MYKLIVLISGEGSNLQAIIDQIESGNINAEITAVISNKADANGLNRAKKANIPTVFLDHTVFIDRESFDDSLAQIIHSYTPDLIVLAGFMRILSDKFVTQFQNKLINIHPSLLPKYKGLNTHKRALENGDKQHGASVHYVIPELDAGTVILQGIVDIEEGDDEDSLANRVHQIEHLIYPKTIAYLADGQIKNTPEGVSFNNETLSAPLVETLSS